MFVVDLTQPGRTYRGASPDQRRAERRERLIAAGIEVFGTTGYRAATVDQICAVAGLTKRYFYESFADSEALLLAAYARATDDLRGRVVAVATAAAPELTDMTRAGLEAFFGAIAEDQRVARLAFFEILGVSPAVDAAYRASTRRFVRTIRALAEPAFAGSDLPEPQRLTITTGIVGSVLMIAQQWVLSGRRQPIETVVEAAQAILTAVLDRVGYQGST
jgi:AcrR family transcriptional regulator